MAANELNPKVSVSLILKPLLLSAKDASAICGVSRATWWSMDSAGHIPRKLHIGKRCLWRTSDLELWVEWGLPARQEFERRKTDLQKQSEK